MNERQARISICRAPTNITEIERARMRFFSLATGESLRVGDDMTVTVLDIDGEYVVLEIDSPEGTRTERRELSELELV